MNIQTCIGNLGQDCQTGNTRQTSFVSFSVAATNGFGDNKKTEWLDCVKFGKNVDSLARFLKKGTKVYITGDCSSEEYNGKTKRKLVVQSLELLGGRDQQT